MPSLWFEIFKAEYKSMTARFKNKRYSLPLILFVGTFILILGLHFLVSIIFELFAQMTETTLTIQELRVQMIQDNANFFFLSVFVNTFIAFFIPISIPLGRIKSEGGQVDSLLA